jgi:UDP-glucose 4-epimerase
VRLLVTGSSGFLGRVLSGVLLEHGHAVVGLSRADLDLTDGPAVARVLRAHGDLDAVAHLAARVRVRESFAEPAGFWATNVGGTANLLAAVDVPHVVFASTTAVYGGGHTGALDEATPTAPGSPYAASKLAAEQLLSQVHAAVTVLRCFNVVGGWDGVTDPDRTRIVNNVLAVAAGEQPRVDINGAGDAVRDFVHVRDAADAFRLALEKHTPGTFNLGTGTGASVTQIVEAARRITGKPVPVRHGPPVEEPHTLVADPTRITETLGWEPRRSDIETILRDAWAQRGNV